MLQIGAAGWAAELMSEFQVACRYFVFSLIALELFAVVCKECLKGILFFKLKKL